MLKIKLQEITHAIEACLTDTDQYIAPFNQFCRLLKKGCEELRDLQIFTEKKDEQEFCHLIIQKVVNCLQRHIRDIFTDMARTKEAKALLLTQLSYTSQALIACTRVQSRFGGRLGYHCLPHTQHVASYPDHLVMCAGANHDAVMRYASPPKLHEQKLIKFREHYHQSRQTLINHDPLIEATHKKMYEENKQEIQTLKQLTEQKRVAGWSVGNSERDSYDQMENQLAQLLEIIEKMDEGEKNQEAIDLFKKQIHGHQRYRALLIKRTVPTKSQFAIPGFGDKLNTIANVGIFPEPAELVEIEPSLRNRLVKVMDHVIQKLKGSQAHTFQQAIDDIQSARIYYYQVTAARAADPSAGLETIEIPRFKTLDEHILFEMPPFYDPMKQLKDIPEEQIIHLIKEALINDVMEHQNLILLNFWMNRMEGNIVANQDLGGLVRDNSETKQLSPQILALIVEENPYQAQLLFQLHHKLLQEGGLTKELIHIKLRDPVQRAQWKVTEAEYQSTLEFLDIAYYFLNQNVQISEGSFLRAHFYLYQPMKALQLAVEDPEIKKLIQNHDKIKLNKIVEEFEKKFCPKGQSDNIIIPKLKQAIEECLSAGALCQHLLDNMQHQFGPHFLKAPQEYGYTTNEGIDPEFLEKQNEVQL